VWNELVKKAVRLMLAAAVVAVCLLLLKPLDYEGDYYRGDYHQTLEPDTAPPIPYIYLITAEMAISVWLILCFRNGTRWERTLATIVVPWVVVVAVLYLFDCVAILMGIYWGMACGLLGIPFIVWGLSWRAIDSPTKQSGNVRHIWKEQIVFRVIPTIYLVCYVGNVVLYPRLMRETYYYLSRLAGILLVLSNLTSLFFAVLLAPVWLILVVDLSMNRPDSEDKGTQRQG